MSLVEDLAWLADVPVKFEVELERVILTVSDLLKLDAGHVISMSRSAGGNVDIYVGGTLIGYGEIVVVQNSMSVRITDFKSED